MTAQTSITAADLRVGDRLVWPGDSLYNVAADSIEEVVFVGQQTDPVNLIVRVEVITRPNAMDRTRWFEPDYPCHVLLPRPVVEDTP